MTNFITTDSLADLGKKYRLQGCSLVLTNGCFDLLHTGHVRYLEQARALGDVLIVAVNSDASVRLLKGPTRPINHQQDRAEIIGALRCVDYVTIFEEMRATTIIRQLRPHIYVKGGDYTPEKLDFQERRALEKCQAEIKILPLIEGRSTTRLIEKLRI